MTTTMTMTVPRTRFNHAHDEAESFVPLEQCVCRRVLACFRLRKTRGKSRALCACARRERAFGALCSVGGLGERVGWPSIPGLLEHVDLDVCHLKPVVVQAVEALGRRVQSRTREQPRTLRGTCVFQLTRDRFFSEKYMYLSTRAPEKNRARAAGPAGAPSRLRSFPSGSQQTPSARARAVAHDAGFEREIEREPVAWSRPTATNASVRAAAMSSPGAACPQPQYIDLRFVLETRSLRYVSNIRFGHDRSFQRLSTTNLKS